MTDKRNVDRARSKLQTMTNTALRSLAQGDAVDIMRKAAKGGFRDSTGHVMENAKVLLGLNPTSDLDSVLLDTLADMVERERDALEKEARHWQLVADRHDKDRQALAKELNKARREGGLPGGIEWPRYEDGRPVRAGDLVTYADTGLTAKVQDILIGSACWELLGQGRRSLGQVGKFGEPVKRPPLLASDGQPIEVGQVLYGGDGRAWEVYHLDRAAKHPVFGREPGNPGVAREMKPEWLTHEPPDSWERIASDLRAADGDTYAHSGTADLEAIAERVEKLAGGAR